MKLQLLLQFSKTNFDLQITKINLNHYYSQYLNNGIRYIVRKQVLVKAFRKKYLNKNFNLTFNNQGYLCTYN